MALEHEELLRAQSEWRAPDRLLAPPPRSVRLTGGRTAYRISRVALLLAAAWALYLAGTAARNAGIERRLSKEGVEIQGLILRKWVSSGRPRTLHAGYAFDAGGRRWIREVRLPSATYDRLREGGPALVRYQPADPAQSRLAGEEHWAENLALLFPITVGAFVAWAAGVHAVSQKRLLERGQPAGGIVTRVSSYKGREYVTFQFLDMSGTAHIGQTFVPRGRAAQAGSVVTVLYDTARPNRNTLYPSELVALDPA